MDRYVIIKKTIKTKFDEFMDHGRILYFGAPCGFGKTTVAFELLRGKKFELISGLETDGILPEIKLNRDIVVIDDLQQFQEDEDLQKQYRLYMENLEQLGEIKEIKEKDKEYIINRVTDIVSRIDDIDKEIDKVAVSWKTDRMAKADLNILRLAYYEMNIDDDIPKPVAVDQAVELAKKYGTDDSPSFVNGVLAKLF